MEQRQLALLGRLDGPSVVPSSYVKTCKTYRQAVRAAWQIRRVTYMTFTQLAAEANLYHQHVSDYLNPDDKPGRRDLPADRVREFEAVVGNTLVSQWLAANSRLTVLEQMQADRAEVA